MKIYEWKKRNFIKRLNEQTILNVMDVHTCIRPNSTIQTAAILLHYVILCVNASAHDMDLVLFQSGHKYTKKAHTHWGPNNFNQTNLIICIFSFCIQLIINYKRNRFNQINMKKNVYDTRSTTVV